MWAGLARNGGGGGQINVVTGADGLIGPCPEAAIIFQGEQRLPAADQAEMMRRNDNSVSGSRSIVPLRNIEETDDDNSYRRSANNQEHLTN